MLCAPLFGIVLGIYGGIMGSMTVVLTRLPMGFQFLGGATIGYSAELINHFSGDMFWYFDRLQAPVHTPWINALLFGGLPAGVMPPLINWIIGILYRRRLRWG